MTAKIGKGRDGGRDGGGEKGRDERRVRGRGGGREGGRRMRGGEGEKRKLQLKNSY